MPAASGVFYSGDFPVNRSSVRPRQLDAELEASDDPLGEAALAFRDMVGDLEEFATVLEAVSATPDF
jgi:hypothetical protein